MTCWWAAAAAEAAWEQRKPSEMMQQGIGSKVS